MNLNRHNNNNLAKRDCTNKQNSNDGTLSRAQRRNSPHEGDVYISEENVVIRNGQANYKLQKHGHDFDLPFYESENGWPRTPRNEDNLQMFKDKLVETTLKGEKILGTYSTKNKSQEVIHYYDNETRRNVMYNAETKEFISAWKLYEPQVDNLMNNKNVGQF